MPIARRRRWRRVVSTDKLHAARNGGAEEREEIWRSTSPALLLGGDAGGQQFFDGLKIDADGWSPATAMRSQVLKKWLTRAAW